MSSSLLFSIYPSTCFALSFLRKKCKVTQSSFPYGVGGPQSWDIFYVTHPFSAFPPGSPGLQ